MLRALALAIGVTLAILGMECIVVQKFILAEEMRDSSVFSSQYTTNNREYVPPEWMPWILMSTGAIVMIYSFTIPRRVGSG